MDKEKQIKLQSALIEVGKEAEAMKETPAAIDMEEEFSMLMSASFNDDKKGMRKHGRKLAAQIIKFMIEKL